MKLIDVHCHLDLLKDLDEIMEISKKNDVKIIITSGIDKKTNRKALDSSKKYDIVKCSIGIYPPNALKKECESTGKTYEEFDINEEINFIRDNKKNIVAIGEVGMDFLDENVNKKEQEELFVKMIKLAKELNLPLIVHSRKAEKEVIDILEKEKANKVMMHCFSGKKSLIKRAAELGYYFSIPTNVNRASNFQTTVKLVNINQLLTETDAPHLGPVKDEINEPKNVKVAIKKIAEIKGFDKEEVANNVFLNYQRLFL